MILGQKVTSYPDYYDKKSCNLLQPIPRSLQRAKLPLPEQDLSFFGCDWWGHYEFSWLDARTGWPVHCFLQLEIPANTPFIIESKSLKLYFGCFTNSLFTREQVVSIIEKDLSAQAGGPIKARLYDFSHEIFSGIKLPQGLSITELDQLATSCDVYEYEPGLLRRAPDPECGEQLFVFRSFRSNCLVTGQPDWAHMFITIRPSAKRSGICGQSLLRYLTSFRQHQEFHEHCVERIFCDIFQKYTPSNLTVYGAFFRRGALDINPIRSLQPLTQSWQRLAYH